MWSLAAILGLALVLPLGGYGVHWLGLEAVAQESSSGVSNRANFWREVKNGTSGYSAVKGEGANTLVVPGGTEWQAQRMGPVLQKLPWIIVGMAGILLLYHLFHGRNKLDVRQLSGRRIKRWNLLDRFVHWITAISFIALAATGLSMLLGRNVLIPLLGKEGFASWAQASIQVHNVLGPVFTVGITLMIIMWIWHNFPAKGDLTWFKQGGGLFSKSHPPAGRMNAGEKVWFWLLATVGVVVSLTGVILVAPVYGIVLPGVELARGLMQDASLLHAILATVWTAIALGHIYIGTAGTEGAFEGMSTGYVSEEWAEQHHNLWHEKMVAKGKVMGPATPSERPIAESGATTATS